MKMLWNRLLTKHNIRMRNLLITIGLIILTFSSCTKKEVQSPVLPLIQPLSLKNISIQSESKVVPNELLIKFKTGVDENRKSLVLGKISGRHKEKIFTDAMVKNGDKQGLALVSMPGNVDQAIAKIRSHADVEYVEPNYIYTNQAVPNDPFYSYEWGMFGPRTSPANSNGSQAAVTWAGGHIGSPSVYVGIIDSGYMYYHDDLAANAGTNPGEIADDGIDNDGNGYIDDVYGWDFNSNGNTVFNGIEDQHGTLVAGIIGAVGGNGIGIAGVCWNVKFLNAKFVGPQGGTLANAIKAIDYFTNLKLSGVNIVATNNSWSGGGYSQALKDAIERANSANILFIAAAGNNGMNTEITPVYPSCYPNSNIISVASTNSVGALSYFSNYAESNIHICAPGESIASCIPALDANGNIFSWYGISSGTSMAAPFVTGAAALFASKHPNMKASQIKEAILDARTEVHALEAKCSAQGRLNLSGF